MESDLKKEFLSFHGHVIYQGGVVDCDPEKKTITFKTANGTVVRQCVEVWSRVMGYHRPVDSYNLGKQSEHAERKYFEESKING